VTSEGWKRLIYVLVGLVFVTMLTAVAARRRKDLGRAVVGVALGWLIPGAGHAWLGRARKGLVFFVLIAGTFAAGCLLAHGRTVTFDENYFYHIGQIGSGMTLGVTQWLASDGLPPRNDSARPEVDPGLLYMSVAGLLNLLLLLNLFDLLLGAPKPAAEAAPGAGNGTPTGGEGPKT
jgi:hypothetical protein